MRVFYVDIYFLINFTVDLLALYFSASLLHMPMHRVRLSLAAAVGAVFATAAVLLYERTLLVFSLAFVSLFVMVILVARQASPYRRLRLALLFFLFQLLIGGIVHWGYGVLEGGLKNISTEGGVENRGLLYLSVLILLAIGILRFSMGLLSHVRSEKSLSVQISVGEKNYTGTALVDSGNFLRDPFDGTAVVLIKPSVARRLLPEAFLSEDAEALSAEYRKRLRLIPVRVMGVQRILFGLRPDRFYIVRDGRREQIRVIIAYDKEEGSFEGYSVLIPSAVTENGS